MPIIIHQGNVNQNHLKDSLWAAIFATMKMTDNDKGLENKGVQ